MLRENSVSLKKMKDEELRLLWADLVHELHDRAASKEPDPFAIIKRQEPAKRAAIVAAAGQHPILFVGPAQCGKTMLVSATAALGGNAFELRTCPCGGYGDPGRVCRCLASRLNMYWLKRNNIEMLMQSQMLFVVPPLPAHEIDWQEVGTNLATAQSQIQKMTKPPERMDDTAEALLQHSIKEWNIPIATVQTIKRVASTVAALSQAKIVRADHMSEAIMYRPVLSQIFR